MECESFFPLQSEARTYLYLSNKTKSVHKAVRITQLFPCPCFVNFFYAFQMFVANLAGVTT